MTYREKIENMIKQIEDICDESKGLSELSTEQERELWNEHISIFHGAATPLKKLNNSLSPERANRKIYL